ncbi:hypothetical protein V496_09455 [Pseudogymnoascus sp. VKM F-4515 (FW-2607)]|nr:hypothetical protein V496_09455 [Pseudogymnoascus sp. VKM F-4515 (FW-2607)]KFY79245.1 hypothetical protein V498_08978 [Pseudogymnoascus sp. VKM F-4517 (FW-2822)]
MEGCASPLSAIILGDFVAVSGGGARDEAKWGKQPRITGPDQQSGRTNIDIGGRAPRQILNSHSQVLDS